MSLARWGLAFDIVGVVLIGLEAFIRTRGILPDSIVVGHGASETILSRLALLGYALVVLGFVVQFVAAA